MVRVPNRPVQSMVIATALALVAAASLATTASANHPRPQGATPKYDPLVLYFNECSAPNLAHDTPAPKAPSCGASTTPGYLTVGTPDYDSLAAQFVGSVRLNVCPVAGCTGSDVKVTVKMTDVRCGKDIATASPGLCVGGAFGPYVGSVATNIDMKITDHCNSPVNDGVCPPAPGATATSQHALFAITTPCANAGPTIGAACAVTTTLNAQVPGAVQGGYRSNVESFTTIDDGGADGNASTVIDNKRFATEGFFVP
jgi:hypothetical protein